LAKDLHLLSHQINTAIGLLDPPYYEKLVRLRQKMNDNSSYLRALNSLDPLMVEGREFLFNRCIGLHTDKSDPQLGWAILIALGDFKGGHVSIPQVGLRVRLEPGDAVMIRGRVLEHEIEPWEGGQRISIPHFTHTSLWEAFEMKDEVTIA
jgi:hypothetical protein